MQRHHRRSPLTLLRAHITHMHARTHTTKPNLARSAYRLASFYCAIQAVGVVHITESNDKMGEEIDVDVYRGSPEGWHHVT